MEFLPIIVDFVFVQAKSIELGTGGMGCGLLDVVVKVSTVIIAAANLFYIVQFNKTSKKEDQSTREQDRNIDLLKTIVLAPNLDKMYKFLDAVWAELTKLKLEGGTQDSVHEKQVKEDIEPLLQDLFTSFRSNFIIILNATTPTLGEQVQEICDTMRDELMTNMADEGINLWVSQYFNSHIKTVFEEGKKSMINALFCYDGKEN